MKWNKKNQEEENKQPLHYIILTVQIQLTFLGMCWCVEECERPLAAGRGFALGAFPPGQVELHVGRAACRTRNVPEYLQKEGRQESVRNPVKSKKLLKHLNVRNVQCDSPQHQKRSKKSNMTQHKGLLKHQCCYDSLCLVNNCCLLALYWKERWSNTVWIPVFMLLNRILCTLDSAKHSDKAALSITPFNWE